MILINQSNNKSTQYDVDLKPTDPFYSIILFE
jgi:hypothetical protein